MQNTIVAFSLAGEAIYCSSAAVTLTCCDVYGNDDGDWVGCIEGQELANGNISADPIFCNAADGDFTLHSDSPCTEENHPDCGPIGAWPAGCGPSSDIGIDPTGMEAPYLFPTSPNPFGLSTRITYVVPSSIGAARVQLSVYDPVGRLVHTLIDEVQSPGIYTVGWDGKNLMGEAVAGGVYFYQLRVNKEKVTKRMVVVH
jgi:hypothetical protein